MGTHTKPCEVCGELMTKKPRISITQWAKARFCSRKCWGAHNSKALAASRPFTTREVHISADARGDNGDWLLGVGRND